MKVSELIQLLLENDPNQELDVEIRVADEAPYYDLVKVEKSNNEFSDSIIELTIQLR